MYLIFFVLIMIDFQIFLLKSTKKKNLQKKIIKDIFFKFFFYYLTNTDFFKLEAFNLYV